MPIPNPLRFFRKIRQLLKDETRRRKSETCLVCGSSALYLDAVDFNKSCEEARGIRLPLSGISIEYHFCDNCGFCFAPEFRNWSFADFERLIYNKDYEVIDPDYKFSRPIANADFLSEQFGTHINKIRHLDYGGGSGLLSDTLCQRGWKSHSYDPFVDRGKNPEELGVFDLVTAFEVVEHVPDPVHLFDTLKKLCKPDGLILFSTLLSDGHIARSKQLDWWYASPRNGHISLLSQKSLGLLVSQRGLHSVSFSSNLHAAFSYLPEWAGNLIRIPESSLINLDVQGQAEAAKNRGNEFIFSGDYLSAVQCYQEALNLLPSYAEAKVNLGSAWRQLGRLQEAREALQDAVTLKPSLWQGHFQLGLLLDQLAQFQPAVDSYHKSIEINAGVAECHWRLGLSLVKLEKWAEAIKAFDTANVPDQDFQEVHANFGFALMKTKRFKEALHQLQLALNLSQTSDLHFLAGKIYEELLMAREAELSYRDAIALDPNNSDAHFQLSFLVLLQGDYLNGFTHFEQRLNIRGQAEWLDPIKSVITGLGTDRYWKGQEIAGTSILIMTEQGLGDSLMMLRYVPLLKKLKGAAKVCVVCDEQLATIFQSIPEVDEVRVKPAVITETDFDWYCTTMSLPHAFQSELNSIPSSPHLPIKEQQRSKWAERLSGLDGLKVGIAWSGNNRLDTDGIRSIGLDRLDPLFSIPGIVWVSLQKGQAADQLKRVERPVHDWMDESRDLMDTAALMECLDLVITVDTSIVHLAGVIGRPTWLFNRYETEWRWLLEREDSPWYPRVRIFRQTTQNDWDSIIEKAAAYLRLKLQN